MKRSYNPIKVQHLEITASVTVRVIRQIVEAAIQHAFMHPNFWIDQLHFFSARLESSQSGFAVTFHVADIADANGFISPKVTDDHIKALLLPVLASMLETQARRLIDQEIWLGSVHMQGVNRKPRPIGCDSTIWAVVSSFGNTRLSAYGFHERKHT